MSIISDIRTGTQTAKSIKPHVFKEIQIVSLHSIELCNIIYGHRWTEIYYGVTIKI